MTEEKNNKILLYFINNYGEPLHKRILEILNQNKEKKQTLILLRNLVDESNAKFTSIEAHYQLLKKKRENIRSIEARRNIPNNTLSRRNIPNNDERVVLNPYREQTHKKSENKVSEMLYERYLQNINNTCINEVDKDQYLNEDAKNSLKHILSKRLEASTKIQSRWRIVISKRVEASTKIQSRWRIVMSKRIEASTKIQLRWRIVMSKRILIKKFNDSISKINNAFHISDCFKEFRKKYILTKAKKKTNKIYYLKPHRLTVQESKALKRRRQ